MTPTSWCSRDAVQLQSRTMRSKELDITSAAAPPLHATRSIPLLAVAPAVMQAPPSELVCAAVEAASPTAAMSATASTPLTGESRAGNCNDSSLLPAYMSDATTMRRHTAVYRSGAMPLGLATLHL